MATNYVGNWRAMILTNDYPNMCLQKRDDNLQLQRKIDNDDDEKRDGLSFGEKRLEAAQWVVRRGLEERAML